MMEGNQLRIDYAKKIYQSITNELDLYKTCLRKLNIITYTFQILSLIISIIITSISGLDTDIVNYKYIMAVMGGLNKIITGINSVVFQIQKVNKIEENNKKLATITTSLDDNVVTAEEFELITRT